MSRQFTWYMYSKLSDWALIIHFIYCRSGNIYEVLIFANFATRTFSRIYESRENYYHNRAAKKNKKSQILIFMKSPKIRNSRKFKHAKIYSIDQIIGPIKLILILKG